MALDVGELVARLRLDSSQYDRGLQDSESRFSKLSGALVAGAKVVGVAAAGAVATAGVIGIKTAAQLETARIGFTTMLGSAQKADDFLKQLSTFAAKTPFEFPELQTAASSLISVGIGADKVIPIMTSLGNATAGMGTGSEGIQRATVAIQQMTAAGKISAEDLNQLRDAGIPVYDLLASAMKKPKEEVAALAQNGKLGKDALDKMMGALQSGAGLERFAGLMDKQSASLSGLWSTLHDTISMGLAQAIQPMIPAIKEGLGGAVSLLSGLMPKLASGLSEVGTLGGKVFDALKGPLSTAYQAVKEFVGIFTSDDFRGGPFENNSSLISGIFHVRDALNAAYGAVKEFIGIFVSDDFRAGPFENNSAFISGIFAVRDALNQAAAYVQANFMPAMQAIGDYLVNTAWPALQQVAGFLYKNFLPTWQTLGRVFVADVLPAFRELYARVQENMPQFMAFGKFIAEVAVVAEVLFMKIAGFLAPILVHLTGVVFKSLIETIGTLVTTLGWLITAAETTFTGIGTAATTMWNGVVAPVLGLFMTGFLKFADGILTVAGKIASALGMDGLSEKLRGAKSAIDQFGSDFQNTIDGLHGKSVTVTAITDVSGAVQASNSPSFHAMGGAISGPGTGTSDSIPAMLSNGEHVLTASEVAKMGGHGAVYAMRAAVRKFADGGAVGVDAAGDTSALRVIPPWINSVASKLQGTLQKQAAAYTGSVSGGAAQWSGIVQQVLSMLGGPLSALPGILRLIQMESGGNPRAINLTDSNAKAGHPSMGLMQTIIGTFLSYAGPFRDRGVYDPLANIYAGTNYAQQRYGWGMLAAGGRHSAGGGYLGYDSGGLAVGAGLLSKPTVRPERVLSPRQTEAFERLVDLLERQGTGQSGGDKALVHIGGDYVVQSNMTPRDVARAWAWEQM